MVLLWLIGFTAGLVAGVSPCVLPVLPVVFAGWTAADPDSVDAAVDPAVALRARRRRAVAVVAGLVVSFSVFTLSGVALLRALGLPEDALKYIGVATVVLVGAGLLVPRLERALERLFARAGRFAPRGTSSGFVLGLGLGLVFTPCAGPVLTAVTTLGARQRVGLTTAVLAVCFAVGAALPMLAIALAGDTLIERNRALRERARRWRPIGGVALIVMALAIQFNWVAAAQRWLPGYTAALQRGVEGNSYAAAQLRALEGSGADGRLTNCVAGAPRLDECGRAPAFTGITRWLQTPGDRPLTLAQLRGHVVLVDFWTYSCINCQRTLPHVEAWYQRYHADGLEVVGVHSPEFAFEHVVSNVRAAARALGVTYPIAVDDSLATWAAYANEYWPAEYLIDAHGVIRHVEFGEGDYASTERLIRQLLVAAKPSLVLPAPTSVPNATPSGPLSPETYLGYERSQYLEGSSLVRNRVATYHPPRHLSEGAYALGGQWRDQAQSCVAVAGSRLELNFLAHDVYLVLGGSGTVSVNVDGQRRVIAVSGFPRLYRLFSSSSLTHATLSASFSPGVAAYDFTFG
jgi:cytochrome c biogenesis protein CcdA/thiol-disulfide isomerase/thioredoxin